MPAAKKVSPERWASLQGDVVRLNEVLRTKDETLFERKLEIAEKAEAIRVKDILCLGLKAQLQEAQAAAELQRQVAEERANELAELQTKYQHLRVLEETGTQTEFELESDEVTDQSETADTDVAETGSTRASTCSSNGGAPEVKVMLGVPVHRVSTPSGPSSAHRWRERAYKVKQEDRLQVLENWQHRLGQALRSAFADPITEELMCDPVVAPDGTSYSYASIMGWLHRNPTDPNTRLPLSLDMLRPNRQLRDAIATFRIKFPELLEEIVPNRRPANAHDLLCAILEREEHRALHIIAGTVDDMYLNRELWVRGSRGSLLFFALDCGLPNVALALVRRSDFRAMFFPTPLGISHLHYAAALGYSNVCRELLNRQPLALALSFTRRAVELVRSSGESIYIAPMSTAMSIARQQGPYEIVELFDTMIARASPIAPN